jgi:heme-degrading monooxygenase HmoA
VSGEWHLAQYNVAKLVAPLDDPRVADFVASLQRVNTLGDHAPGFVWRPQSATGDSTGVRVGDDPLVVVNFTVWESVEALFEYTYHSEHVEVFRRRREWFEHDGQPYLATWWAPAGRVPTVTEERLAHGPMPTPSTSSSGFRRPATLRRPRGQLRIRFRPNFEGHTV